jgi:signal peptidase I
MYDFERGDIVYIRDFPFGKPTRINGKVVGILHGEYYNILLTNGLNEGTIISYKSYQLIRKKDVPYEIREDKEWQQADNKTLQ